MGPLALKTIGYYQNSRIFVQMHTASMDDRIGQSPVPIMEALYLHEVAILLKAVCLALCHVTPKKRPPSGNRLIFSIYANCVVR